LGNGQPQYFDYLVQPGDRISVYPAFSELDINSTVSLRPPTPQPIRFLLDNHLGRLARYLRLLGFDTLYFNNNYDDAQLANMAHENDCVLLSRDRGLLKRNQVIHGFCLRSKIPQQQVEDVLHRYQLHDQIKPWCRCLRCNGSLKPVAKEQIIEQLEPKTKLYYHDFQVCEDCRQIYWRGSHFEHLESFIERFSGI
jgi:uncharacterized protein with PIN domain